MSAQESKLPRNANRNANLPIGTVSETNQEIGVPCETNQEVGTRRETNREIGVPCEANQEIGDPTFPMRVPDADDPGWHSRGYLPHYDHPNLIQHVVFHLADSLPKEVLERLHSQLQLLPVQRQDRERRKRIEALMDAGHGACVLCIPEIAAMVQGALLFFQGQRYRLSAWVVMPNHVHALFQPLDGWTLAKIVASWKKFTARGICEYFKRKGANQECGAVWKTNQEIGEPGQWKTNQEIGEPGQWKTNQEIGEPGQWKTNQEIGEPGQWKTNQEIGEPGQWKANLPIGSLGSSPVWHREYWDRFMRDEIHYLQNVEYIHLNPVKAGLVAVAEDWPWSSMKLWKANLPIGQSTTLLKANREIGVPGEEP